MTDLSYGVRRYTINAPTDFNILEFVKRKLLKYNIAFNHGRILRADWLGELGMTK